MLKAKIDKKNKLCNRPKNNYRPTILLLLRCCSTAGFFAAYALCFAHYFYKLT